MALMYGPEELLDVGGRRRPVLVWVLVAVLVAGGLVTYLVTRSGGGSRAVPAVTPPATTPAASGTPGLPEWPHRAAACGGLSFLPIVASTPLAATTGIRAVVGDRLTTVDLDTGSVRAATGLPSRLFASQTVTTAAGTFATLAGCDEELGGMVSVVRIDRSGVLHTVARGRFDLLLGGGNHPWGLTADEVGRHQRLYPLDGGRPSTLPDDFSPIAAWRDQLVGSVQAADDSDAPFGIRLFDPRTGRLGLALGPATSMSVDGSTVLWTGANCYGSCVVHRYDLATGKSGVTRQPADRVVSVWGAIVSPDGRTAAFVRPRATPGPYDQQHPGNPNEIVTVDLDSGAVHVVPGLVLWSKSAPGLAYSADGRWLLLALDEGSSVRMLLWRPGLGRPLESRARVRSPVAYTPTVTPLS
jgi:hypothetical protein